MPLSWSGLLAAISPLESFTQYWNRAATQWENRLFLLFGTVIVCVWVGLFLWERRRRVLPTAHAAGISLFEELCLAHALSADEIACLQHVAQFQQLSDPSFLFVQPESLQAALAQQPQYAAKVEQLQRRLFD